MKKTLITLMALAGMASAVDLTYTNLFNESGWDVGSRRGRAPFVIENGTATVTSSNWGQAYANYNFSAWDYDSYAMSETSVLTFNVTMKPLHMGLSSTLYIETTTSAYVIGKDYDQAYVSYGKGNTNAVGIYNFDPPSDNNDGACYLGGDQNQLGTSDILAANTATTITATVAWDAASSSYSMTLSDGTSTVNWNLGTDKIELKKIGFYADGANNTPNVEWSNFSFSATNVTLIPEPATATLSLLALAGLAARRRRK